MLSPQSLTKGQRKSILTVWVTCSIRNQQAGDSKAGTKKKENSTLLAIIIIVNTVYTEVFATSQDAFRKFTYILLLNSSKERNWLYFTDEKNKTQNNKNKTTRSHCIALGIIFNIPGQTIMENNTKKNVHIQMCN